MTSEPQHPRGWLLYPPFDDTDEWKPFGSPEQIRLAQDALEAARRAAHEAGIGGKGWRELWQRIPVLEQELARLRGEEYAVEIEIAAPMSVGAPQPTVISHEHGGTSVVYLTAEAESLGVLTFSGGVELLFGGPNDEALHKHRLYGRGLEAYRVHEVFNSRWAALTWNYHVPVGKPSPHRRRHFVIAFHDSLLEILAPDMVSRREHRAWHDVIAELATKPGP